MDRGSPTNYAAGPRVHLRQVGYDVARKASRRRRRRCQDRPVRLSVTLSGAHQSAVPRRMCGRSPPTRTQRPRSTESWCVKPAAASATRPQAVHRFPTHMMLPAICPAGNQSITAHTCPVDPLFVGIRCDLSQPQKVAEETWEGLPTPICRRHRGWNPFWVHYHPYPL